MGKIFSIQVAVPTIVVLSVGGFQMLNQGFFPYHWVLWGIAIAWLVPCLILRRQSVDITIHEYELRDASDRFYVRIEGFIHSRHPDGLKGIKLWLISSSGFSSVQSSRELHSIDSKPQMFSVSYCVSYELTEQAMVEQKTNGLM